MEILCRSGPRFAVVRDAHGHLHTVWVCPAGCSIVELEYDQTTEELVIEACVCGAEPSPAELSHALRELFAQLPTTHGVTAEGGDRGTAIMEVKIILVLPAPDRLSLSQQTLGTAASRETSAPPAEERRQLPEETGG